ncbi:hypothetical protein Q7689_00895 [Nocardiopsis tropica]|uniref:putative phage holin n=1 Tax=Nocardiopsis tropica TaxID=109330 RepID=UPI002E8AA79D|nr:hypothetical protein [Nocardiopsis tropica]
MYELGNWVAIAAGVLTWGFLIDYLTGTPWHRSSGGRLFVCGLVVLTAILTLVAVRLVAGEYPGHEVIRLAVYSAGALTIAVAWAVHRRVRCRDRAHDTSSSRGRHRS